MRGYQVLDQLGEFQKVGKSKRRPPCAENDLRIGDYDVCPLRRNRADSLFVDLQKEALAVAVVSLADADEPSPVQRVERMRDEHKIRRSTRRASISY